MAAAASPSHSCAWPAPRSLTFAAASRAETGHTGATKKGGKAHALDGAGEAQEAGEVSPAALDSLPSACPLAAAATTRQAQVTSRRSPIPTSRAKPQKLALCPPALWVCKAHAEIDSSLSWARVASAARGLDNNGNTCFLNATLQCLAHTPALVQMLVDRQYVSGVHRPQLRSAAARRAAAIVIPRRAMQRNAPL